MAIFQTILVPLDGSQLAETAIPMAVTLSRVTGAEIVLLRVLEEMRPIYDTECREVIWVDPANPRLELLAPEILQPTVTRLAQEGLSVQAVIRLGDPRTEIIDEAERHPAPVIVMASHGRGGLSRVLLGSVATRVLQAAPCPVLIVRARAAGQQPETVTLKSIAVPLDGSKLAEQALDIAAPLARAAGATIHLVRVAETYYEIVSPPPEVFTQPIAKPTLEMFERLENEAEEYLAATAERLEQESIPVTWEVLSGDPGKELLDYVDRARPDLMVITTHGRGGLSRWFYGSIADKLVTASEVPVLLVRAR
ncbi:universal stress protein [Nitrolancea hollandica]|uniref:UspA domain protein n=1 Tax=Nitrolancea hollandica Lb TaxID=1129897 RepID=I4EKQ8_9BACT|nr:universal stress protein [Nitrolancea hollandica]CCF85270.1 UspA domain protein [Nitrolancea hollandica Lb]